MNLRTVCVLMLCAGGTVAWANPEGSASKEATARAFRVFAERIQAYIALQQDVERSLSPQRTTVDVAQITTHQQALAAGIVAARRDSHLGDIFTPEVGRELRAGIRKALEGPEGRNIRRTIRTTDLIAPLVLRVNDVYSDQIPVTTMPATLLRRLPILPGDMAYRIIARSLVLQDIKTNLIVDVLPDAIPPGSR